MMRATAVMPNSAPAAQEREARRLVEMRGLSKVFVTEEVETHALGGVDLAVREGEFLAIAGPSGCGKTTLLSILGLLDTPSGGEYILGGRAVEHLTASQRAQI